MRRSHLEIYLADQFKERGLTGWRAEYKFNPARRWRADFAFVPEKILVECEGGTWGKSRHTSPVGFAKDCEKYNAAAAAGWLVLRYTGDMIMDAKNPAVNQIERAVKRAREGGI